MPDDFALTNLTNHFLIAMPALQDDVFHRSVVYLCEHSDRGALGLIINKPCEISMTGLFEKLSLPLLRKDLLDVPVFLGGPVQNDRGFVLHDATFSQNNQPDESVYASTMVIAGGMEMTTSKDVLEAISAGFGPARVLVSLGYAAWGEGQLESELSENSWLTVAADPALMFELPFEERYDKALKLLGLEAWMLSIDAGHA
ncbi:MAG: YqgE/AlgH family protein [Rhodoferax sp.]|nr:YqgE/AlgH family protein [Rhodoferax sp.]MBP7492750.1 YqgE/AlgH family protein [Rhodoferax sp.]